ncbi:MAG: ABC transporter substrate-binding protein [Flavitalea sp.]
MLAADPTGHMFFTDQTGYTDKLRDLPKNIVSLVPSQTELLYDLGLEKEVTGITKFCIHPPQWKKEKTIVGGTKKIRMETIQSLHPDLIIANKEENTKEDIEYLRQHYPVYTSDINNLDDALKMISDLGNVTGKQAEANSIIERIGKSFEALKFPPQQPKISKTSYSNCTIDVVENRYNPPTGFIDGKKSINVAYLIWRDPYMAAGSQTFIHSMIQACGWTNAFEDYPRYPEVHLISDDKKPGQNSEVSNITGGPHLEEADVILLSSEPYPFAQKHIDEIQEALPGKIILLVDGEMFSWYGSRLLKSVDYFSELIDQIHKLIGR